MHINNTRGLVNRLVLCVPYHLSFRFVEIFVGHNWWQSLIDLFGYFWRVAGLSQLLFQKTRCCSNSEIRLVFYRESWIRYWCGVVRAPAATEQLCDRLYVGQRTYDTTLFYSQHFCPVTLDGKNYRSVVELAAPYFVAVTPTKPVPWILARK